VDYEAVVAAVEGVPHMTPEQGRIIYDHVRATKPERALELGVAHGVGAAYIAAALHENGRGELTTVDSAAFLYEDPTAEELMERLGLSEIVTVDRSYSTYTWFLKEQIEAQSDADGNCEPRYDFVYLDGAKEWTIDGLAVFLIEKVLRHNGWLLMDDLDWTFSSGARNGKVALKETSAMSDEEWTQPHLRKVFELIVQQHPSFTEMRIQDGWWGWARKAPGEPRQLSLETSRSMKSMVVAGMRFSKRRMLARS
jgi:predicted O-methyltransferase YrrM